MPGLTKPKSLYHAASGTSRLDSTLNQLRIWAGVAFRVILRR